MHSSNKRSSLRKLVIVVVVMLMFSMIAGNSLQASAKEVQVWECMMKMPDFEMPYVKHPDDFKVKTKLIEVIKVPSDSDYDYKKSKQDWPKSYYYYYGEILTPQLGRVKGPSGDETYYNLPMGGVIDIMRSYGPDKEWYNYKYWVRKDGVKMYGDYVMVAANLNIRKRGSLVKTTRGMGIVCDTGSFAYSNPYQLDIAVNW